MPVMPGSRERLSAGYSQGEYGPFINEGAPTNDDTLVGTAVVGSLLIDTTNGKLYICTATNGTDEITWTVVGAQTA